MGHVSPTWGGEMHLQNAKTVFIHRGIECWTKRVKDTGAWKNTHCGYFRMTIPGVSTQAGLTDKFLLHGGADKLPNGGRFTYLVKASDKNEVVAGFDGMHDHNINDPLSDEETQRQIKVAVDFLLDNGIGQLAHIPTQA